MSARSAGASARELRRFGFGVGLGAAALGLSFAGSGPLARWLAPQPGLAVLACAVALALASAALVRPLWLEPLRRASQRVVAPLGAALTVAVLALFFFAILSPIALALRASGRDPLLLRRTSARTSYWHVVRGRDKQSYFRQS